MVWSPTIAVTESRAIAENLLTFFEANQADAILWANGSALRPIQRFENSVANRNLPVYPAVTFIQDVDETVYDEDIEASIYTVNFLLMVTGPVPATVVSEARKYTKALESMIVNCPAATLGANTGAVTGTVKAARPESQFNEIKTNGLNNDFMQEVVISVKVQLVSSHYV